MADVEAIDYFSDAGVADDPYPYFTELLEDRPVWREPHHGVVMVTGFDAAVAVYQDPDTFSSANRVAGPEHGLPVTFAGDDISDVIDEYRHLWPQTEQIVTMDPPVHTAHRALLMGLITPKRLKENEDFMWRLADRKLDEILPNGRTELVSEYAKPYTTLAIADLMGVPEVDHAGILEQMGGGARILGNLQGQLAGNSLDALAAYFVDRVVERRAHPGVDILTRMAAARFPDGSLPEPIDVARVASMMFAAGQETTVRLLAAAVQRIADDPALQARLRADRALIPNFIEELLRIEGPIKGSFRIARRSAELGGVVVPAGTTLMLLHGAASRDPRHFAGPAEFDVERSNAREHLAFGRGIHYCPGAPLARSEARISLERLFDRTADVRLSEAEHGPAGERRFEYLPTYRFRALDRLFVEFTLARRR